MFEDTMLNVKPIYTYVGMDQQETSSLGPKYLPWPLCSYMVGDTKS
jgi:hypothetical protein